MTPAESSADAAIGSDAGAPLHWRAGDWQGPPVDVSINPETGGLRAIQAVLQDRTPERTGTTPPRATRSGLPEFDTTPWAGGERYRDETHDVAFALTSAGHFVTRI